LTSPNGTATFNPSISPNLLILTPANFFSPNTTYTINLPYNAVTDSNGNTLTTIYSSTFNTGSGLNINSVDPTSGATNVALNKEITITFNNNIQPGAAYNNISVTSPSGTATFNPSISGSQLTLTPAANWTPNTTYTVNIPYNALTDTNGNTLTTNYTSTFTTGPQFAVTSADPTNGAVNVALNKKITINFNYNIWAGSAYNNISVTSASGSATVNPSISGSQLILTPTSNWTPNTTYTINIPYNAVTDSNGNTLSTNYTSTFTTGPQFAVTSIDTSSATTSKKIIITFNYDIKEGTAYNNINVYKYLIFPATFTKTISGNQLILTSNNWTANAIYSIKIPYNAVTDTNGNTLTSNYSTTFII